VTAAGKHTLEPWMAAAAPSSVVGWPIVGPMGRAIASVHCLMVRPPNVSEADWQAYRDECEANARLIAAAPELLGMIKRLLNVVDCGKRDGPDTIDAARALLAKAGAE